MYDTSENEKIISFLSLIFRVCGDCDVLPQPNPAGEGVTPLDHLHDPIQHRGNAGVQAGETGNKIVIEKVILFVLKAPNPGVPHPLPKLTTPRMVFLVPKAEAIPKSGPPESPWQASPGRLGSGRKAHIWRGETEPAG